MSQDTTIAAESNQLMVKGLADSWEGVRPVSGEPRHYRTRDIRNLLCLFQNRSIFSSGVSGDHKECMEGLACGILQMLMQEVSAPRGGLAACLGGIHSTRVSTVLNEKRWPAKATPVRDYFRNAVFWILLGKTWETLYEKFNVRGRTSEAIKQKLPDLNERHPDWSSYWCVRHAMDIVDYFFPFDDNTPQPFFLPERRNWNAPFDRRELGKALTWSRWSSKANGQRTYLAFFVPNAASAAALFDSTHILPPVAFAAKEHPELFRVDVFYPHEIAEEKKPYARISSSMRSVADKEVEERAKLRGVALQHKQVLKRRGLVAWYSERRTQQISPDKRLRAITSFMYLGQCKGFAREVQSSLYILRPFCRLDSETPMALKVTPDERDMFMEAAEERYQGYFADMVRSWLPEDIEKIRKSSTEDAFHEPG